MPITASPFDGPDNLHRTKPGEQLLEQHAQFQPSQIGAQAIVHTLAKPQVRIGFSGDIELIGAVEHAVIAIRRAFPDLYLLSRRDRLSAEL